MPSRERSIRVEAIVLSHSDWGEADRLLGLYTREMGKLRSIAKGVRKPRSRKAGHLEPFTRVSLLLAKGRDMWIVTQADTVNAHLCLREDLERVGYAAYAVELLDRFTYEEGENPGLYRLLSETLARLDTEPDPQLPIHYYEMRLLDLLGFRPQLLTCNACGEEIHPVDQYFSASLGSVLCPRCGAATAGADPISMDALKYLRHFQRSSYNEAARARPAGEVEREIERILQHYLTYLLERALNTPSFLRKVRQQAKHHGE